MAGIAPLQLADIAITLVTGLVYAYVGMRLARRRVDGEPHLAWVLFTHWWYGVAALTLVGGVARILRHAGIADQALHVTLLYLTVLLLCYALWALLYYLAYLFTGNRRVLVPISLFYVGYFTFVTYAVSAAGPYYDAGAAALAYARPFSPKLLGTMLLLLATPHILGAVGYFTLFFRTTERTQRYRIGIVAWSIIVWFSTIPLGQVPLGVGRIADYTWWPLVTRSIGLAAATAILLAYRPPAWVRERYRIHAVDEQSRTQ